MIYHDLNKDLNILIRRMGKPSNNVIPSITKFENCFAYKYTSKDNQIIKGVIYAIDSRLHLLSNNQKPFNDKYIDFNKEGKNYKPNNNRCASCGKSKKLLVNYTKDNINVFCIHSKYSKQIIK